MGGPRRLTISDEQAGSRLDVVLGRSLAIGRARVRKLLESGAVRVAGHRATLKEKGRLLEAGAIIEVESAGAEQIVPCAEMEIPILREGDGWIAVDKPAGVAVHPLGADERGTVLNALVARFPGIAGVGEGGLRSGVVHRLDVDTSGVLLVATRQDVWQRLRDAFAEHRTRKVYRAIVEGTLAGRGREVMELVVARHRPARVKVVAEKTGGSRRCDLSWGAIESLGGATLIEVELGTGFLHQIRAMMAYLGHPVVGDRVYGLQMQEAARRQMLHAAQLHIGEIHVQSPLPADFEAALRALRP